MQLHRGGPRGGAWNEAWAAFFRKNPAFDVSDIYQQGLKMLKEFGVKGPGSKY